MVPSVFSSLFPKARVSVIAGSVGFRAYFMPQPWQSQLPFFVGIPSAETIAVCAPQQGDSPSPLWGRQLSSGALPAFDLLGMAASLGMGNHGGFLTQIPTCCRGRAEVFLCSRLSGTEQLFWLVNWNTFHQDNVCQGWKRSG